MLKMIIEAPLGFDLHALFALEHELYLARFHEHYDGVADHLDLSCRYDLHKPGVELDAAALDRLDWEVFGDLLKICPQVAIYFERGGARLDSDAVSKYFEERE